MDQPGVPGLRIHILQEQDGTGFPSRRTWVSMLTGRSSLFPSQGRNYLSQRRAFYPPKTRDRVHTDGARSCNAAQYLGDECVELSLHASLRQYAVVH
jgi:hypothetical protein